MITEEQFNKLNVGDLFEHGLGFSSVTNEPIAWRVDEIVDGPGDRIVVFELFYFDLPMGSVEARLNGRGGVTYGDMS